MKVHQFRYVGKLMIFNLLLILVGCTVSGPLSISPEDGASATSPVPIPLPTTTPLSNSPTAFAVPSTSPAPTVTITISFVTSTATASPQPIGTETPVPIPTPPGVVRREQVLWLYETNNGCLLPCWWGILPGQTEWAVAKRLLRIFDQSIYHASTTPGIDYYEVSIPLPPEVFLEDHTTLQVLVQNGIVEIIDTDVSMGDTPSGYLSQYTLPLFLTTYGQPTEVWLSTSFGPFEHNELPFRVALFYSDLGIAALYSDNGIKQEGVVSGCPQQDPVSVLSLWNPQLDLTFEQVVSGSSGFNVDYLSLEESTDMDVIIFYETFKQSDNTTCLETVAELWH